MTKKRRTNLTLKKNLIFFSSRAAAAPPVSLLDFRFCFLFSRLHKPPISQPVPPSSSFLKPTHTRPRPLPFHFSLKPAPSSLPFSSSRTLSKPQLLHSRPPRRLHQQPPATPGETHTCSSSSLSAAPLPAFTQRHFPSPKTEPADSAALSTPFSSPQYLLGCSRSSKHPNSSISFFGLPSDSNGGVEPTDQPHAPSLSIPAAPFQRPAAAAIPRIRSRPPPETEEVRKEKETNRSAQTEKKTDRSENKGKEIKTYCLVYFFSFFCR